MMKKTSYKFIKVDQKKKLDKNNEAKMTLYNDLPCKEYERVFMCKTAKEVWHTLIITHQGNSQVKICKIDILTQEYEKFSIFNEETIDSGFTRYNAIVTNKATAIEEAKDLDTLPLDKLVDNIKVYEMILEIDDIVSKTTTKENVKSLALKAKATREQTRTFVSSSTRVIDSNVEIDLVMVLIGSEKAAIIALETKAVKAQDKMEFSIIGVEGQFASECTKPKENKAFFERTWSVSD
uniref:DUF4219 domain-containing protein/UBN2 domain-containing protein n=1 Tax=Tanacetum cinerariifolium TaxID=118510 RepID=A0A6L2LCX7_TANCI|nr:hypothetical protein [Tanacetum cinerariifolium]